MNLAPVRKNTPTPFTAPSKNASKIIKKQVTEEEIIEGRRASIFSRFIEKEGITENKLWGYALMYYHFAPGECQGPISAKRINDFFEGHIKEDSPVMYNKMVQYYHLDESQPELSAKKKQKLFNCIESYIENQRSLKNAMSYSLQFEEAAKSMAPKLDAPGDMSILERVKWLRLWAVVFRGLVFFWTDLCPDGEHLKNAHAVAESDSMYIYPESMISIANNYYNQLPDGDIIYENLRAFIELYPESVQNAVYRFGELDKDVPDSLRLGSIRQNVKKKLFYNSWRTRLEYFMSKSAMKMIAPESIELALNAIKNGGIQNLPVRTSRVIDVFNNCKTKEVKYYEYGIIELSGVRTSVGVSCEEELNLYLIGYNYLLKVSDFRFGVSQLTISEYGLDQIFHSTIDSVTSWILESGYATSEDDINWDIANIILKPEENKEIFENYFSGLISSDDVFNSIGFSSVELARMSCSFSGLACFDSFDFNQALKRVKMFGFERSSKSDKIYATLYRELSHRTNLLCGKQKKPASSYGIRYVV